MKSHSNIFRCLLVFFVMYFAANSSAQAENRAAQYLVQSGVKELDKGNEEGAIRQFRKALLLEQDNEDAHYYLYQLGASADSFSDSPRKKQLIVDQASQALGDYQQEVARLDAELNRMLFRLERIQYEKDHDQASYLYDYGYRERIIVEPMDEEARADEFPVRTQRTSLSSGPGGQPDSGHIYGPFDQGGYHDLQTAVDLSSRNEQDFHLWLAEHGEQADYDDQFAYQDKLIQVLDDYLDVREIELQSVKDDLIHTAIDLGQTQKDLVGQIDVTEHLNDVYAQVMRKGDGQAFYISEENSYMKFLENKLDETQDQLIVKASRLKEQDILLACLEEELEVSRRHISSLLEEREQLLNQVVHEVNTLRKKDSPE
ncbi:MAG: hypothetical protein AB7S78_05280 [Candidatus Omnitrophota bacterium]